MTLIQKILDLAERASTKLNWAWAVFQIIAAKDKLQLEWRK